jgi:hypothetical protein
MATLRLRALGGPLGLLVLAGSSLVCSGTHPSLQAPPPSGPPALVLRRAAPAAGALAFPPSDGTRRPRSPIGESYSIGDRTATLTVSEPSLDGQGSFSFTGTTLHIVFNQPVRRPEAPSAGKGKKKEGPIPAAKGTIRIAPEVAGASVWLDERTLEFKAAQPFDKEQSYTVELGEVATPSGKKLDKPWKASFTASPSYVVAGKELGYLPVAGEHQVIAVHPFDDARVSRTPVLAALYDQPIDLGLGRSLLHLEDHDHKAIPFVVEHPSTPTFQGIKVDPRHVLLVRPVGPLPSGSVARLRAEDRTNASAGRVTTVNVVEPLAHTDVSCGWGYYGGDASCSFDKGVLTTTGKTVHVLFNNALATSDKALASRVRVTPFVKNLSVRNDSWGEGRLMITGQLEPSKSYEVSIDGLRDQYEQTLGKPVRFTVKTEALSASVAMPEGLVLLDEATTKRFVVTTRNVSAAEIVAFPVPASAEELSKAIARVRALEVPEGGSPVVVPVSIEAKRDQSVETAVDLSSKLSVGTTYITTLRATGFAFGASPMSFPVGSEAGKPPLALLAPGSPKSLAAHVQSFVNGTMVQVTRLGSGEPVAGATVRFEGDEAPRAVATDARGLALLDAPRGEAPGFLRVKASDAELLLPMA